MLAGCGGDSLGVSTAPLAPETAVEAQRYLADVAAATEAVGDYVEALGALPDPATPEALRELAPALEPPLARVGALQARLAAERLDDQRLDEQRAGVAAQLREVLDAMRRLRVAAAAGRPTLASMAGDDLRAATELLREGAPAPAE